jgi:CelD/BcsL family acetyltransferase involved in cellulose biosynthesis
MIHTWQLPVSSSALTSGAPVLRIQEVGRLADLERLREPWNGLMAACPDATPFHSPEWLLPWAERFGQGPLWVVTVWRGEALVGLAPWRIAPRPGGRTVCFLGSPVTDYHGLLVAPGAAGEGVQEALVRHLIEGSGRWDVCDFEELRPHDPLLNALLPRDFDSEIGQQSVCPYVPLAGSAQAFNAGLPHGLSARLERALRGLRRFGPVAFELGDEHNFEEIMDALFRLHAARWETRHSRGVLSGEAVQDFHREAAAGMLERGRLRLIALRVCGGLEAVVYAMAHGRKLYSYIGGFNPVLARYSPGLLTIWQTMLAALEEGLEEFDFLRGDEAYKHRFGTQNRWNWRRMVRHS